MLWYFFTLICGDGFKQNHYLWMQGMRMEHEWSRQGILKSWLLCVRHWQSEWSVMYAFSPLPHSFSLNWFRVLMLCLCSDQSNLVPPSVQSLPFECCLVIFSNIMKKTLVCFLRLVFWFLLSLFSCVPPFVLFDLGPVSSKQGREKSSGGRTDWKSWPNDLHYY